MKNFINMHAEFKNRLLNKPYKYINKPIPLELTEYQKALEAFLYRFSKYHNVKSIYRFGFISSLGISDLDFIIVLNDPLKKPRECLSYRGFTEEQKYIYNNTPPIYLSEKLFQKFTYVLPFKGIELLHGKSIKQVEPEKEDTLNLLIAIEICTLFYPRVFLDLLFASRFDIRRALCLLNALQYPIKLINTHIPLNGRWEDFCSDVEVLRKSWFQTDKGRYKRLVRLVIEAIYISMDLIEKIADFIVSSGFVRNCDFNQNSIVGSFRNGHYLFAGRLSKEQRLDMMLKNMVEKIGPRGSRQFYQSLFWCRYFIIRNKMDF